ncbi:MAG: sugar phosphate nucleotidyltransferase [Defluviitaleaceae bacterium]|nr:sugar phosphate nucleotidyltransferase [Defluviitaleaceae bacterium]
MGSRFGGLKQIQPVDGNGCFIIDYSAYDAIRAGAEHIIFVIKKETERDFRETIGARIEKHVKTTYVYQDVNDIPPGFSVPEGRTKPWGTGHAVMAARNVITGPFATVNADDFYGRDAYAEMFVSLKKLAPGTCVMAGYELRNTLSEMGSVSRGICRTDSEGLLLSVEEHHKVQRQGDVASAENSAGEMVELPLDAPASLNMWGFAADIFADFAIEFEEFIREMKNPATDEFYLPSFVQRQIVKNRLEARVWRTKAEWRGITYIKDLDELINKIAEYKRMGYYPESLW